MTDYVYTGPLDARYARFTAIGMSTKIYNLFWSGVETDQPSSATPMTCAEAGSVLFPADEPARLAGGYHRFRCIRPGDLATFDDLLSRDAAAGIQSAVVMWSAPAQYREPGCQGFPWAGGQLYDGCAPRNDAMDDWEDYVGLLAERYSGTQGHGKIGHFIVWNENASGGWFDTSPRVPCHSASLSAADVQTWLDIFADMLTRAHAAVARHSRGALLEVSTDAVWEAPPFDGSTQHIGSHTLLEGVWTRVGNSFDWSVAVHPYGDPLEADPGWINFAHLGTVTALQEGHLAALGVADPAGAPQARLIASEQGWQQSEGDVVQARNVCEAQELVSRLPEVVGVTHNLFQDPGGDSAGSFGIVPYAAGLDLAQADGTPGFEAYRATGLGAWRARDDLLCCTAHRLGCATPVALPLSSVLAPDVLAGWPADRLIDGDPGTIYSSGAFASSTNDRGTYVAAYLPGRPEGGWMVSRIELVARLGPTGPLAFPQSYSLAITSPDNSAWVDLGSFTTQPDASGVVSIALPQPHRTFGLMVTPTTLGPDDNGNYYFQLGELRLWP